MALSSFKTKTGIIVEDGLLRVNTTAIAHSSFVVNATTIAMGANVTLDTIKLLAGNSVANLVANSIIVSVANSTGTSNLTPTSLQLAANMTLDTVKLLVGNSTANLIANSVLVSIANSTATANLSPTQLVIGSTTANTSAVASPLHSAGANVTLDTVKLLAGNTTVNALVNSVGVFLSGNLQVNSTALQIGNSSVNLVINSTTVYISGVSIINNVLKSDTTANLQVGYTTSSSNLGIVSSGTLTPNVQTRPICHYFNNGAHTLAPITDVGSIVVDMTNQASAGAVTISGFTKTAGDTITTTNAAKFRFFISKGDVGSFLFVQAMT